MSEFTKGEWRAKRNATGTWTIATEDTYIADVDRHFNAYLIAAAPAMYEALKALEEHMTLPKGEIGRPYLADVRRMADKALAKAEERIP